MPSLFDDSTGCDDDVAVWVAVFPAPRKSDSFRFRRPEAIRRAAAETDDAAPPTSSLFSRCFVAALFCDRFERRRRRRQQRRCFDVGSETILRDGKMGAAVVVVVVVAVVVVVVAVEGGEEVTNVDGNSVDLKEMREVGIEEKAELGKRTRLFLFFAIYHLSLVLRLRRFQEWPFLTFRFLQWRPHFAIFVPPPPPPLPPPAAPPPRLPPPRVSSSCRNPPRR